MNDQDRIAKLEREVAELKAKSVDPNAAIRDALREAMKDWKPPPNPIDRIAQPAEVRARMEEAVNDKLMRAIAEDGRRR
jgi:hypothetical protein